MLSNSVFFLTSPPPLQKNKQQQTFRYILLLCLCLLLFLRYTYSFVGLVKLGVLTHVGDIQRYKNDRFYYYHRHYNDYFSQVVGGRNTTWIWTFGREHTSLLHVHTNWVCDVTKTTEAAKCEGHPLPQPSTTEPCMISISMVPNVHRNHVAY